MNSQADVRVTHRGAAAVLVRVVLTKDGGHIINFVTRRASGPREYGPGKSYRPLFHAGKGRFLPQKAR